jgi:hypothetical protein
VKKIDLLFDAAVVVGHVLISCGVWQYSHPAGVIVFGAGLLVAGLLGARANAG